MVCAIVSVNYYFDRYRGLASGIAMSGSGVGTLIVPVLYNWIMPIKGWRFCLLLYSLSASLLTALASLTFKPFISNDSPDDPELTEQSAVTDTVKESRLDQMLVLKTVPEKFCTDEDALTPSSEKNRNKTDDLTIHSTNNKLDDNLYDSNGKRERKFSIGFINALRQYLLNSKESTTLPEVNNDTEDAESMIGSRLWKSSQGFKRHRPSDASHQKRPCQVSHSNETQKQNYVKFPRKTTWATASAVHDHIHSSYNLSSIRNPRRKQFTSQTYNIFDKPDAFYSASLANLNRKTIHPSNGYEKSDNSSIYVSGNVKNRISSKSSLTISPETANKNKNPNELINSNASFQLFPVTTVNQHHEQQQQQIKQEQFPLVDNPVHKSSRCNICPELSIIDKSIPEEKVMTIPRTDNGEEFYSPTSMLPGNKFKQYLTLFGYCIIKLFDLSLFTEVSFLYLIGIGITSQLAYFIPFVYLIDCAVSYGMEQNHAVLIVMILSILHTIGRLVSGIMSNVFHLDSVYLSGLATFVGGLAHLFLVFIMPHTFTWYAVYASIYGLCSGIPIPLIPILLVRFSGLERLTASFSNLNLLKGIASMIGPTVAVSIVEYTSQKDRCFLVAGICYLISALLHLGLCRHSCFKKYSESDTNKQNTIDYDDEDNFEDPYAKCCSCSF
ncbi:Monocarboxylate transporter 14 isoform 2 [Schistosoma japonicum]|nr:Monocarboxylate transporter 14 isoform 2 [Schistosoma japonicum]